MIKGKTPEEIRKTFNIKNDFTEEEEAQVGSTQPIFNCFLKRNWNPIPRQEKKPIRKSWSCAAYPRTPLKFP
jgi:hypothetical protein